LSTLIFSAFFPALFLSPEFCVLLLAQQKLSELADKIKGLTHPALIFLSPHQLLKLVLGSKALCFERKSYLKNNLLSQSHLYQSVSICG
jgi:hypothetical protein